MTKWIEQMKAVALEKYPETLPQGSTGYSSRIQRVNDFMSGATAMRDKVKEILETTKQKDFEMNMCANSRESVRQEILKELDGL